MKKNLLLFITFIVLVTVPLQLSAQQKAPMTKDSGLYFYPFGYGKSIINKDSITYCFNDGPHCFKDVKKKFDTLIPVLRGLYICNDRLHWGVIDSSGKIVVPFICDGAMALSDTQGIASAFIEAPSMNTNVPRYTYWGYYFYFTKAGYVFKEDQKFRLTCEGSDFHHFDFPIKYGPKSFLPDFTEKQCTNCIRGYRIFPMW